MSFKRLRRSLASSKQRHFPGLRFAENRRGRDPRIASEVGLASLLWAPPPRPGSSRPGHRHRVGRHLDSAAAAQLVQLLRGDAAERASRERAEPAMGLTASASAPVALAPGQPRLPQNWPTCSGSRLQHPAERQHLQPWRRFAAGHARHPDDRTDPGLPHRAAPLRLGETGPTRFRGVGLHPAHWQQDATRRRSRPTSAGCSAAGARRNEAAGSV
jgi:hypothetical protein